MPGNELGDGVHNFFAQENASQGQHHSQGNWPLLGNNFLVGGQRQSDVANSNCKPYNLQNSDVHRRPESYPFQAVHGLNFPQSNLRPEFPKAQPPNEQANLNGFMYGNQFHQTRQSDTRFPTADRDSDQRHFRGLPTHELQHGSPDHRAKASGGSETLVSFDLFSGQQQQINHLPWQTLPHQQSGIGDMQQQQLQQQYMIRKMQEVQMQQQQHQHQQQNMINQVPHFTQHALNSETLQYPWTAGFGANWMKHGSSAMQGSANGLVSPPNMGQSRQVLDMGPQQVDQSLYGVPVSSSRGLNVNEYSHMMRDRSSLPQMPVCSHTFQGNQHNLSSVQVGAAEGSSRQKFQNMGGPQQFNNFLLQNTAQQVSDVRRDRETLPEKPVRQVATSQSETGLDPTEENILFGSDDNVWAAFESGETGNSYDHAELSNGLPSIPCGSWSALMQSAVAEASSSDAVPQEEWSGLILNSNNDSDKPEASFMDNNTRMPSTFTSGSISPFDINANNVMGSNHFRHKSQNEPGQKMQFEMSRQQNRTSQQQNVWNSVVPGGDRARNNHEKLTENSQSNQLRVMQGEVFRGSSVRKSNSGSSSMELVPGESTGGNAQTNNGILTLNDSSLLSIPSNVGVGDKTSQFFHNNNSALLNNWKSASVLNQVNDPSQVVDSSNNHDKEEVARREMDNRDNNENSSDSHHSNLPKRNFVGVSRENGFSNARDSQTQSFAKQKSSNQVTRKVSVPYKFQFHPMGNLDEDDNDRKQPTNAQAAPQFVESNFFGQASRNSTLMGKGQSSQLQSKNRGSDDEQSRGYAPNMSVPFNRSFDAYASNTSTSQNMLELLNKVDHHSTDPSAMMQFDSSELPESEKFDGLNRSQSSVSQGFGLQLGPPSQRPHKSEGTFISSRSSHSATEMGENIQHIGPTPVHFSSNFNSGIQSQQTARLSGQISMHQQLDSSTGNASCSEQRGLGENFVPNASASAQQDGLASRAANMPTANHMQTSQNLFVHGISRQIDSSQTSQTMWTNVPTQLLSLGPDFNKVSPHVQESLQPNIVELSSPFLPQGYANSQGSVDSKGLMLKEISGQPGAAAIGSEPDPNMKGSLGNSPANSASTLKDIEASGRSLQHNSSSHQNYPSVNETLAVQNAENRASKRVKGSDNLFNAHQVNSKSDQNEEHSVVVSASPGAGAGVASDHSGMLSFSMPAGILQRNASQPANVPSQDVSESNSCSDHIRVDHPQVSPQMAPSWFNQYGTFKNGQVFPMHDSHKLTFARPGEPPVAQYKPFSGLDTVNTEDKEPSTPLNACQVENSHLNLTNQQHMKVLRPAKKRSATSELHPWHKDVVSEEASQNFWSLSMAVRDWSKATNRLIEKDEDGADFIEDREPMLRSRRRLKLTTRLMQQLFRPAPPAILSADATSDCESVAFAVSRIGLGDACSSMVSVSADLDVSRDDTDVLSAKGKLSGTNGDQQHTAKVVEELIERARNLENDFLRLDKSVSITDLKVDCQDLEKFAVINRFARFHGRGQADSAEATSSADAAQKPVAQRYVTAHPIPRSLPDRVQCLSL